MSTASRLQISLTAKGLKNISGYLQMSDPFAIVTVRGDNPDNKPTIAGHTDVVYNSLKPNWSTVIILEGYKFGVPYFIEIGVFDFSAKKIGEQESDLAKQSSVTSAIINRDVTASMVDGKKFPHKPMGTALFEVGEVLGSRGNVASKSLQTAGEVFVHVEPSKQVGPMGKFRLKLGGLDLPSTAEYLNRTTSPFYEMFRRVEKPTGEVSWNSVYRSNVVRSNLNPVWAESVLDLETLCNGDLGRTIKIVIWAYRRSGKHKLMGEFKTSVRGLTEARSRYGSPDDFLSLHGSEDLTVEGIVGLEADKTHGNIVVLEAEIINPGETGKKKSTQRKEDRKPSDLPKHITVIERPSFVDYITGGCKIGLAVAIDFTASNGDPEKPESLHYVYPSQGLNDYEKAIVSVGDILARYDSDQKFPVWGFGAKHGGHGTTSHCFQCGENEEEVGVEGILEAYRNVFLTPFGMSSQTVFTDVIQTSAGYAAHQKKKALEDGKLSYTILLILTAGNVEKVSDTMQELNAASKSPLSVVIVGIGDADFTGMEFLDADHHASDSDITQFVRFNDYKSYNALTEAVLEEIPDQLVDYFYSKGIMPGQAEQCDVEDVKVQEADHYDRLSCFLGTV